MMIIGFTGSQEGMTSIQRNIVYPDGSIAYNLNYNIEINIVYCVTCKKQATILMFNMDFDNPAFGSYCSICEYLIAEWR